MVTMAGDHPFPSTQAITESESRPPRRLGKALVFLLFLLPHAWYVARPEWDYYASYSGVVVSKGTDCNLFACLVRAITWTLYVVLQDDAGKRSN